MTAAPVRLRLPATSANLGPGFDALGLALGFALHLQASPAETTTIRASGRNNDVISRLEDSLILDTYRDVLATQGQVAPQLALTLQNDIPLGMGCGSSAAALVAGVSLAVHFGRLQWSRHQILAEASRREGHPDNVAACVLGGLAASAMHTSVTGEAAVRAVSLPPHTLWKILLAIPASSLSTKTARALLPDTYSRADVTANLQAVALLTAAFTAGRGDLLAAAMADRIHQPFRSPVCPLLPALLPLAGNNGILGVALSGAGPSVLLILDQDADTHDVQHRVKTQAKVAQQTIQCLLTTIGPAADLGPVL